MNHDHYNYLFDQQEKQDLEAMLERAHEANEQKQIELLIKRTYSDSEEF